MNNSGFSSSHPLLNTVSFYLLLLIPVVLLIVFSRYHIWDLRVLSKLSEGWTENPGNIYRHPFPAKYPIGGTILSAGVISTIRKLLPELSEEEIPRIFKGYLTVFDILSAVLLAVILGLLELPNPFFFSLLIYLLPSTWAGAALWGQIDNITQFFIRLSIAGFLISMKNGWSRPDCRNSSGCRKSLAAYAMGVLGFFCGILTKQTFVFSMPGLLVFWFMATCSILIVYGKSCRRSLLLVSLLGGLFFFIPEIFIRVPDSYIHQPVVIFQEPLNPYGDKISGHGFNVWMFLGRPMDSSSGIPICLGVSPRHAGYALYLFFLVFLWWRLIRPLSRYLKQVRVGIPGAAPVTTVAALIIVAIGMSNLGFNVLLTGTHDRYLYHTYPFLIAGFLYFRGRVVGIGWRSIVYLAAAATVYGGFICARLDVTLNPLLIPGRIHFFLTAVHLILLVWLSAKWVLLTGDKCCR